MKTVLACTDGSVYAPSIYDHAAWAARRLAGRIHLLHVIEPHLYSAPFMDMGGGYGIDGGIALKEELIALEETRSRLEQARAVALLNQAREHLREREVPALETEASHGALVEAICRQEHPPALVVLGKRGQGADFAKLHLGSNLERVIRASRIPVLVASRGFKPIERVLIAFDGGPSARLAIDYAASSSLLRDLDCLLLTVGKPTPTITDELAEAAHRLNEAGLHVSTRNPNGDPVEQIAKVVREEKVDLLVMGAYGHSRIRQFIVGSTTSETVRTCLVPVLMFK